MTRIFRTIAGLQTFLQSRSGLGFVPTMGALHRGHLSLIDRAKQDNELVVVSIFINPLQFAPHEDFDRYPKTWEQDVALCEQAGVTAIFAPDRDEILPDFVVSPPPNMVQGLCGAYRSGHFQGVCTIVMQLLQIVRPDRVYLGQKDGQQVAILEHLVKSFHLPIQVVRCPTVREDSGLAISSRNCYLSPEEQQIGSLIYQSLSLAEQQFQRGERITKTLINSMENLLSKYPEIRIEYIECVNLSTLSPLNSIDDGTQGMLAIAAYVGKTRLIDNVILQYQPPIVAIDGPAGAGKSTIARIAAEKLNLIYLDSGAIYRAITWAVLQSEIELSDIAGIVEVSTRAGLEITTAGKVFVNGDDVTDVIRNQTVTESVSAIAAIGEVREIVVSQLRLLGRSGGVIVEGRDIGAYVFPDAALKFFLTASSIVRARRRLKDLQERNLPVPDLTTLQESIDQRDYKDIHRAISPLRQSDDAILIDTDEMTIEEVVDQIISCYKP